MLRTIREVIDSLMIDVSGHIFSLKMIASENKALIIKDGDKIVATLSSKDKSVRNELFDDEIYEQIKKQALL